MRILRPLLIVSMLFAAFSFDASAQQLPLYSNYFFTPYIYNPAQSGSSGVTEASIMHRRQWSAVQGSPETSALTLNGALNDEKIGYSIYGFTDKTDIVQRTGFYGSYAYHVRLTESNTLSFGLSAGYLQNTINLGNVRVQQQSDPILLANTNDRGNFDLNFGVNFTAGNFQAGAAVPNLLGAPFNYSDNFGGDVQYELLRHYVFNTQYDFEVQGDKMLLSPLVFLRMADNVPIQIDAGAMFNMTEFGYVGAMYRSDYAVTANIGIHLTDQLSAGYAHDFSTSEFASALGTSNEFILTYRFGSNKRSERLENEIKKLKQSQRRQSDDLEETLNDRLEEMKDELEREREKMRKESEERSESSGADSRDRDGDRRGDTRSRDDRRASERDSRSDRGGQDGGLDREYDASNLAENVSPGAKGYYVVAGVFSKQTNADNLLNRLSNQGFKARSFRDPGNNFYYVYLLHFNNYEDANRAKSSKLNGRYDGQLWIKIIE